MSKQDDDENTTLSFYDENLLRYWEACILATTRRR